MTRECKKGKGCLEDICGRKYTFDEDSENDVANKKDKDTKSNGVENVSEKTTSKVPLPDTKATAASCSTASTTFKLKNPLITADMEDILYHLALGNKSHDLVEMFGDVKFVCCGGTPHRMERFAYYILHEIGYKIPPGTMLQDISIHSHRYALFKVGPVISVSHGMGQPSISILLHELIKLMFHAGVKDPIFFRLGTCGGLGVEPGTVVITTEPLNGMLEPVHMNPILGKRVDRPAVLSKELANELIALSESTDNFKIVAGKTICTDDFYEGQGRMDGAFCDYTEEEKFAFLKLAREKGVTNIEMESLAMASITNYVGIKCGIVCVTLLDRLKGDQINQGKKTLEEWQDRPMVIVARYIKKYLKENGHIMGNIENKPKHKRSIGCPDCVNLQKLNDISLDDSGGGGSGGSSTSSASSTSSGCGGRSSSKNEGNVSGSSQSGSSSTTTATPSSECKKEYGCLPGCSVVVSSSDYLQRVLDESSGVD